MPSQDPAATPARLYLVDGMALLYRSFHAIRGLATSKGMPSNAVYGLLTTLRKLLEEEKPEYIAVAWDHAAPTLRQAQFEAYKAQRKPMPEDLVAQLPYARRALEALSIPTLEEAGYEADDLIATATRLARAEALEVVIVSNDKDLYQLLGPGVIALQMKDTGTR